ncbi:sodium ion-translocating decarboxylase subunit beta [Candidatus Borkfalkia ceftriaxoniphila]|jgi:sodium ion-translocating decarboxylase, beta subunit|nr:sodium ion-translocating decarboxylase subunit beta [Candidatus Borkfalkia ceftriaxoniphila]
MQSGLLLNIGEMFNNLWEASGLSQGNWQNYVMILISFVLMYLAIVRKFEPLLLLPIAFGMFIINIPGAREVVWGVTDDAGHFVEGEDRGLLGYLYFGVEKVIYPPLIFLGIGAMTDFGPLIANPKSMLIGAAAQFGVFFTLFGAVVLGFDAAAAASIAIIGGADGPTAIYLTQALSKFTNEDLLATIAIAAYSYMALIPIIQRPIMKALTTKKERAIKMKQLRTVTKLEKIIFPLLVTLVVGLLLPDAIPLLGMLMLGNLMKESGVVDRLSSQAQNGLMNTITIFLGICVGCKAYGEVFLAFSTLKIILLGLFAFCMGTVGGLLMAKLMNKLSGGKINPLIGSAGVSAVPMAARISENVGREADPNNHLLMHAMGPNVAGVIGSAVAAGFLLACFGG